MLTAAIASVISMPLMALERQDFHQTQSQTADKTHSDVLDKIRKKGRADLSNSEEYAAIIQRLEKMGYTPETRPHLFSLLEKSSSKKSLEKKKSLQSATLSVQEPTNDCQESDERFCQMFFHTGFSVRPSKQDSSLHHLVFGAIYTEANTTDYVIVDLALTDDKHNDLTRRQEVDFFGEGESEGKRKSLQSSTPVTQKLVDVITNADKVYGDAWAMIVRTDADGNETVDDPINIRLEYNKEDLLDLISTPVENNTLALNSASSLNVAQANTVARKVIEFPPGANSGRDPNKVEVLHPINTKFTAEKEEERNEDDERIVVCLNRDYGDCDYDRIYTHTHPTSQVLLKIPFKGSLESRGKILKVYGNDNYDELIEDFPESAHTSNGMPTNIFVEMKQTGGAFPVTGDEKFTTWHKNFAQHIRDNLEESGTGFRMKTKVSWDVPRDDGVFGNAKMFGRYTDSQWFANIVFSVEFRGRKTLKTFVIGSEDPDGSFFYKQPMMNFVYSCLAKGSMITLANGQQSAIETLEIGDQVIGSSEYSPNKLMPLTIEDISVGVELIPMIEVTTDKGQQLLLTESHPVITQAGQSVWAKNLEEGERIQVAGNGSSTETAMITSIKEVEYKDSVYNLKLARPEGSTVDTDHGESFTMLANDVLVGDLSMQYEAEIRQKEESTEDVLNRLPKAWHQDYLNSLDD